MDDNSDFKDNKQTHSDSGKEREDRKDMGWKKEGERREKEEKEEKERQGKRIEKDRN